MERSTMHKIKKILCLKYENQSIEGYGKGV